MYRVPMAVLKGAGILLFLAILARLDRTALITHLQSADVTMVAAGCAALLMVLGVKAWRWHVLALAAGARRSAAQSIAEFFIGVFLSTFTPAKLGEFGKLAYLRRDGIDVKTGALLVLLERMADIAVLVIIGAVCAIWLWGWSGFAGMTGILLLSGALFAAAGRCAQRLGDAVRYGLRHHALIPVVATTAAGWALHYVWAILLARGLGMALPVPVLITALTGASVLSALPIAPSGLGTRDAALLALLVPYGADPERTIALALLMFASLLLVAVPGGMLWLGKGRDPDPRTSAGSSMATMRPWTFADVAAHWDSVAYDESNAKIHSYLRRFTDSAPLFSIPPNAHVLDIDCRTGNGTIFFAQRHPTARFHCMAMAPSFARIAERKIAEAGISAEVSAIIGLPLPAADAAFDVVLCYESLEHVPDPRAFLQELSRVMKAGGTLVLTTPNRLWEPVHWLSAKLRLDHGEGPHRMLRRREILNHLAAAGFAILEERTFVLIPAGPRWLLAVGRWKERWLPERLKRVLCLRRTFICRKERGKTERHGEEAGRERASGCRV